MIDRTQEDINQDVKIEALQRQVAVLEHDLNDTKMKGAFLQHQLDAHAKRFDLFEPLKLLIEHAEAIRAFFRRKPT